MKELARIYKELGQDFINDLAKDYLVVTEKLSGSAFSFEKSSSSLKFFKSNDKPINLVDRTLMVYYENPINYIKQTTLSFIDSIPANWRFCFQYFVHNEPGVIKYDKLPKNNLVLTHIQVKNQNGKFIKIIEDPRVIQDWSNALGVTPLLPIFKGYLTDEQKDSIKNFISTPIEDQLEIFKTSSFAEYLIKILNPKLSSTILQDDLTKPIESIIFKFYKPGTTQSISAKLIDPYTANLLKHKEPIDPKKVPADINEILLLDILAFIEERGLKSGELLSTTPDERYLELISSIFNEYVTRRGKGLKDLGIEKAEFAKGDEFKLNVDLIPSQATQSILKGNDTMQDLFKIMLGSLRKKRNPEKVGNILTPSVVEDFNELVTKIEDAINKSVDDKFKTFSDYLNLKKTNESYETAEDIIIEEKTLNYNGFINLGKIEIPYSNKLEEAAGLTKRQQEWIKKYERFTGSTNWIKPKSKIRGEVLRADFGMNDGTAEKNIENFLLQGLGIKRTDYSIEQIKVGTYVPNAGGKISSDYDSYAITIVNPIKDNLGDNYKNGDIFYITNRVKIEKSTGTAAVIGKKDLTPDAMGLPTSEYKDAQSLFSKVESYVNRLSYPDNYKNFIIESTRELITNSKNANSFSDFETYANASAGYLFYDITDSLFDGIDSISINNFQNDYGEILGGFMLFNLLRDAGAGLRYPTASNEKLVDFFFDDYSISSKAGSGGTPSGDTIIQKMYSMYNSGHLHFDTQPEIDFLNNVVKQWVNPPKLDNSMIYNNVMNLCSVNIPSSTSNSGYWYILSKANLQPNSAYKDMLITYMDDLSNDEQEFKTVMSEFYSKTGVDQSKLPAQKVYDLYVKQKAASDKNRIGFIFYPLMVEIEIMLNNKFQKQLTKYGQLVTDVKQLYLDVLVKGGLFRFKTVPFKTAEFKFERKGSIPNPFNANIGIRILK
jgi:hypothetical protein